MIVAKTVCEDVYEAILREEPVEQIRQSDAHSAASPILGCQVPATLDNRNVIRDHVRLRDISDDAVAIKNGGRPKRMEYSIVFALKPASPVVYGSRE